MGASKKEYEKMTYFLSTEPISEREFNDLFLKSNLPIKDSWSREPNDRELFVGDEKNSNLLKELKNEKDRKEVVEVAFCSFVLSRIAAQISPVLDQIHIRVKRKFPDMPERTIDAIRAEVIKSQNTAAELASGIEDLLDEYIRSTD